uniref:Uncharacterized protein n=1 Tax=Arundo donax TaxID=35708 RepID=A0A0A9CVV0_ARUDO
MYFFISSSKQVSSALTLPLPLHCFLASFVLLGRSFSPTASGVAVMFLTSPASSNFLLFDLSRSSKTACHLGSSQRIFQQWITVN